MSKLRENLIEQYIEVAKGFYFEGSDEDNERKEYAPLFVEQVVDAILQALPEELYMTTRTVGSIGSYNEALSDVRNILLEAKENK